MNEGFTNQTQTQNMPQQAGKKRKIEDMTDHELLVLMAKKSAATARDQKLTMIACAALGVIFAVALVILVPKAIITLNQVNDLTDQANESLAEVDGLVSTADTTLQDIDTMVNNANGIVLDNSENITAAVEKLSNIDFEGLNESIEDLHAIIEPIAKLFGKK